MSVFGINVSEASIIYHSVLFFSVGERLEPETSGACDPAMLHLCRLETAQVKLVTYRVRRQCMLLRYKV